jgi:hypothetical protein
MSPRPQAFQIMRALVVGTGSLIGGWSGYTVFERTSFLPHDLAEAPVDAGTTTIGAMLGGAIFSWAIARSEKRACAEARRAAIQRGPGHGLNAHRL